MGDLKARLNKLGYEHAHGHPCSAKALNLAADAVERIAEVEAALAERDRRIAELEFPQALEDAEAECDEARIARLERDIVDAAFALRIVEAERDQLKRDIADVERALAARQAASCRGDHGQDP